MVSISLTPLIHIYLGIGVFFSLLVLVSFLWRDTVLTRKYVKADDIASTSILMFTVFVSWLPLLVFLGCLFITMIPLFIIESFPALKNQMTNKLIIVWRKKKYNKGDILIPIGPKMSLAIKANGRLKIQNVYWCRSGNEWRYTTINSNGVRSERYEYVLEEYYELAPKGNLTTALFE